MPTWDSVRRLGLGPVLSWLHRLKGSPAVWGSVSRDIGILWLVFGTLDALLHREQLPMSRWHWYSVTGAAGVALILIGVIVGEGE
jgi:hypothetical protein